MRRSGSFIFVVDEGEKAVKACESVIERAGQALKGVPEGSQKGKQGRYHFLSQAHAGF